MVIVRALLASPRVSAPPVTQIMGAVWVSHVSGVGVVGVGVLQVVLQLTMLVMLIVCDGVGAGSGYGSARGGSLACCGRCWPACLLVLAVFIVFLSCPCWVAVPGGG